MTAALVTTLALAACTSAGSGRQAARTSAAPRAASCENAVDNGELPSWARSPGFRPGAKFPHVVGSQGAIVGVLFGYPLHSPPAQNKNNKILWIPRSAVEATSGSPSIKIEGRLQDDPSLTMTKTVLLRPGSSIVDVPRKGCWAFQLSWNGKTDTVIVPYV